MAENEILDVGSPRRYRKWRSALCDLDSSPETIAGFLEEEFVLVTRKCLQGTPLYLILQACGNDRDAMQRAVESCKNRDLARYAEQAYRSTGSRDINVLANHIASALTDSLQDRARIYVMNSENLGRERYREVEAATETRLNTCKGKIVRMLVASLRNEKLPRRPVLSQRAQSPCAVAGQSLLVPAHRWTQEATDHA